MKGEEPKEIERKIELNGSKRVNEKSWKSFHPEDILI